MGVHPSLWWPPALDPWLPTPSLVGLMTSHHREASPPQPAEVGNAPITPPPPPRRAQDGCDTFGRAGLQQCHGCRGQVRAPAGHPQLLPGVCACVCVCVVVGAWLLPQGIPHYWIQESLLTLFQNSRPSTCKPSRARGCSSCTGWPIALLPASGPGCCPSPPTHLSTLAYYC